MITPLVAGDVAVVLGLGVYGRAVSAAFRTRGIMVIAIEDSPNENTIAFAADEDLEFVAAPSQAQLEDVFGSHPSAFVPSPGVPEWHPAFSAADANGVVTISEFDMARWWDDRPIAAITGTDGKTTVAMLTVAMLEASGVRSSAVGNTDTPLITAIDDDDVAVFVVEASSFRLGHTQEFSPRVAAWLNFGADHLDVHRDLKTYELAKAKIWQSLPVDGVAIANDTDAVVMAHLPRDRRVITIGSDVADGHRDGDVLVLHGEPIVDVADMPRSFDHDITNTLAAAAIAIELGATSTGIADAVRAQSLLPHRIQHVASIDGIEYYNDSKATVPHAVVTALRSFDRVVLIAGGRNKGLDLSEIAEAADHIEAAVVIGEAAPEIEAALEGLASCVRASDMADAVHRARALARPGGVVLLSPGCASYDAYTSYSARGDDFIRLVSALGDGASL